MLSERVAVITGAASGIGLALVQACLQEGMQVVMADCAEARLFEEVARLQGLFSQRILGVVCDVSKRDQIEQLAIKTYQQFHRVDWLINNAGISGHLAPVWTLTHEHVSKVLDVNLHGVLHGVQLFLPLMFEQGCPGHIVNMSSFYGLCSGSYMGAYAMSKHAIVALSESLFFDLKRLNKPIGVSVVCPSFANTALMQQSEPTIADSLHGMVSDLMARCRPASDVAAAILRGIKSNTFYILPDKEVKQDCEQRTTAIVNQTNPHEHSLEKIILALSRRVIA